MWSGDEYPPDDYPPDDYPPDEDEWESEEREEWRDPKVDDAKEDVLALLKQNRKEVYYATQLAVRFEKEYFHWLVYDAVAELIEEEAVLFHEMEAHPGTPVRFITHRSNRNCLRRCRTKLEIVRAFSEPTLTRAIGLYAEGQFLVALASRGFTCYGRDVREYRGRQWTKTEHDLDFIIERDGVVYGCEVKNTWSYIPREELQLKVRMCETLGIRPHFIMRYAPKSYLWEDLRPHGGTWTIFKGQVYPLGQERLVERIRQELGLDAVVIDRVSERFINRFMKYVHERIVRGEL